MFLLVDLICARFFSSATKAENTKDARIQCLFGFYYPRLSNQMRRNQRNKPEKGFCPKNCLCTKNIFLQKIISFSSVFSKVKGVVPTLMKN
jgi:hypothetical protein